MCYLDHKKGWMAKNWSFELWCFSRFLRAPYTTRISNQSVGKEINIWPLMSQLRHLLRASRWKDWMLPLQKCLNVTAPSKEFVVPPLEEAQKGWRLWVSSVPRYMRCILPSSTGGQGAFWALEEGDDSGIHWEHHLPSRTAKNRAGICGRELVTGVWEQEGTRSAWTTSPKLPWRRSPVIRSSEMWWRESISLPLRSALNEEVVEFMGHHELFHGLDHPLGAILGTAAP